MALNQKYKLHIKETIKECLRIKFKKYSPESDNMPFHYRLLGKDRMALFSFIQSLNTTFGTSIYEPVALELSKLKFKSGEMQFKLGKTITDQAQSEIQQIMNELSTGKDVDKISETERIRRVARKGKENAFKTVKADLCLVSKTDEVYMFDLKTVKPNIGDFVSYKRNMLEWLALFFYDNPKAKVNTMIAIPYNPYEPKQYERWTMKGMLDIQNEVLIADEFWNFLSGEGTYQDLLQCFEMAGIELRSEIDTYFEKFNKSADYAQK